MDYRRIPKMAHFDIPSDSILEFAAEVIVHRQPGQLDSLIISDFPAIFAEFRGKQFSLLWRGIGDGVAMNDIHCCCDNHANTLTEIFDTKGNNFSGFMPMDWESRVWNGTYGDSNNCQKVEDSLKSFFFSSPQSGTYQKENRILFATIWLFLRELENFAVSMEAEKICVRQT
jgi:hypothetical protein